MTEKVKFKVVTQEEAEKIGGLLVCGFYPPVHEDDIVTLCVDCSRRVVHRPHAPKSPVPVCLDCFATRAKADANMTITATETVVKEVAAWFRKGEQE